ncbi:hypothetical protein [Curtobacterium sp. VKM Ac-1376]|uniref:hypothetical protein n=1 Tax=Curtobacterium sp. VKM Ac-1376 TaxID=123312 RepID=UPI00188BE781|nr:hypothetical protein [Curtobacterium sp. VKM Ac-1376]MBF4616037.1 hypothetical protein [Curtobacterium sp. VKM Ac-1376]
MPRTAQHRHTFPPAGVLPLPEVPDGAWNHDLAHAGIARWVARTALLTRPDEVVWVDGSDEQWRDLVTRFTLEDDVVRLDPGARPGSLLVRSRARSTAPASGSTGAVTRTAVPAAGRAERRAVLQRVAEGMRGRTMYVVPFLLGSTDVPSTLGVHVTDSPASVATLRALTSVGADALDAIGPDARVVRTVHATLLATRDVHGRRTTGAPVSPSERTVLHDERGDTVWVLGSDDGAGVVDALRAHTERQAADLTLLRVHDAARASVVAVVGEVGRAVEGVTPAGRRVDVLAAGPVVLERGAHDDVVARPLTIGTVIPVRTLTRRSGVAADTVFVDTALTEDGDVWWPGADDVAGLHLIDHRGHYVLSGADPATAGATDALVAVRLHRADGADVRVDAFVVTDPAGAVNVDLLAASLGAAMPTSVTEWGGPAELGAALDVVHDEATGSAAMLDEEVAA